MRDGLVGGKNSALNRKILERELGLPEHLSANALLDVLNSLMTVEEYRELVSK
jgi:ribonuclease M5